MTLFKKSLIVTAMFTAATAAQAEVAANIGVTSDYVWRGVSQSGESASVSGGVDYSDDSGIYVGTWVGSLGEGSGSEVDLYLGYGGEAGSVAYDFGYIYYAYPSSDPGIDFGEIYGSVGIGAFSAGLAYTTNNDSANDDAGFESGDIYVNAGASFDLNEDWSLGLTVGSYMFDSDASDNDIDYVHYQVDFGTSTDMGDFTFSLSDTDIDGDDLRAVVSWGIGI